jgi:ATP-binding cassette, subfamily B, bacterial PglK
VLYLRQIIYIIGGDSRRIPFLIVIFIASSALDVVGLGIVFPYVSLLLEPDSHSESYVLQFANLFFQDSNTTEVILIIGVLLVAVFLIKVCFSLFVNWRILSFSYEKGAQLRTALMDKYQNISYGEYLNRNSADYINSIQLLSAQFAQNTMQAILRFVSEGIMLLAILLFLAWTNPTALAIFLTLVGGVVFLYDKLFRKKITAYGKSTNIHQAKLVKGTNESIEGLKEIRILGIEPFFLKKVKDSAYTYAKLFAKSQVLGLAPRYILEFCLILFIVIFVFITIIGGFELQSIVPTLTVFAVSSLRLIPSANSISNGISQLRFGRHATQLIYDDLASETGNVPDPLLSHSPGRSIPVEGEGFSSLELREISFSYPSSDKPVLNKVSLSINAGEIIGIVGSTGSGKTTLINVMLGLLKSSEGQTLVNNNSVADNLLALRRYVAYLPQQIFLTDDSLRNNIALGIEPNEISDQKIRTILGKVSLSEFVEDLPEGLDTSVGEHGMRLSGGQCQRVALARSLYHDRSMLVLDESTSALDGETEKRIISELRDLRGEKTVVMIAHRLTTLQHCDRIYSLNENRSLTVVSYEDLLSA